MQPNEELKKQFLRIVDNQARDGDPPEVAFTLERLKQQGYSIEAARLLIAQCVAHEVFEAVDSDKPYNNQRYRRNLERLPEPPES